MSMSQPTQHLERRAYCPPPPSYLAMTTVRISCLALEQRSSRSYWFISGEGGTSFMSHRDGVFWGERISEQLLTSTIDCTNRMARKIGSRKCKSPFHSDFCAT